MDDIDLTNLYPLRAGEVRAGARDGNRFVVVCRFDGEVTAEHLSRFAVRAVGHRHLFALDAQAPTAVVRKLLAPAQLVLAHELASPGGIARDDLLNILRRQILELRWRLV